MTIKEWNSLACGDTITSKRRPYNPFVVSGIYRYGSTKLPNCFSLTTMKGHSTQSSSYRNFNPPLKVVYETDVVELPVLEVKP